MYTLTFADGTELTNLTMNGTNFVSATEVDESIFTNEALASITVTNTDDGTTETWENCKFVHQINYNDFHGNTGWYLAFTQMSDSEIEIIDMQNALVELYETIIGG